MDVVVVATEKEKKDLRGDYYIRECVARDNSDVLECYKLGSLRDIIVYNRAEALTEEVLTRFKEFESHPVRDEAGLRIWIREVLQFASQQRLRVLPEMPWLVDAVIETRHAGEV